jgi:hypothetical protein
MRCTDLLWLSIALAIATPAHAGTLSIDFDFTGSTVTLLGGVVTVPPDGSVHAGSGRIDFLADDGSQQAISGAAQMGNASLGVSLNKDLLGIALITGDVSGAQSGVAGGSLNAALTQVTLLSPLQILYTGTLQCAGTGCGAVGTFPVVINTVLSFLGGFNVGNLASTGNATLQATLPFSLAGFTGILQLSGVETSRTFVPEPSTAALVALGLVGLGAVARLRPFRLRRGETPR